MIIVEYSAAGKAARIQARGNFSLGAGGLLILLCALAAVTLGLAAILAWHGYWPVLAVALVQVALVLWILVRAWRAAWIVEEFVVDACQVRVRRAWYSARSECRLEAAWARVCLEPARYAGYPPRLILRSMNQQVELGSHLTVDEKLRLAGHLKEALAGASAWR